MRENFTFVWLDWMKTYTEDTNLLASGIKAGESFLDYFWAHAEPYRDLLSVHRTALRTDKDTFDLPGVEWGQEEIGVLVMDFAHDRGTNEAMWRVFSPSFSSGNTIIVFNQYGNVPAWELREFCREKSLELIPLHKPCGSAKAFSYVRKSL
jgi:hypothetical protein